MSSVYDVPKFSGAAVWFGESTELFMCGDGLQRAVYSILRPFVRYAECELYDTSRCSTLPKWNVQMLQMLLTTELARPHAPYYRTGTLLPNWPVYTSSPSDEPRHGSTVTSRTRVAKRNFQKTHSGARVDVGAAPCLVALPALCWHFF